MEEDDADGIHFQDVRNMNVLSVFDGISCCRLALERAGHKVDAYYASEIDKSAIKVAMKNYPDTVQIGDVTKVRVDRDGIWAGTELVGPVPDLLAGGFPCQDFSVAGLGRGFEGARGTLFYECVRLQRECLAVNPDLKWLWENVLMKQEWEDVISRAFGMAPIVIDAALVSAQSRKRNWWTNIGAVSAGLFGHAKCGIPQPKDRGIMLRDILEAEVEEKYYLSEKAMERISGRMRYMPKVNPDKTGTLSPKNNSGQLSTDSGTTLIQVGSLYDNNADAGRIYSDEGKARTLKGESGGLGGKMGLYQVGVVNDRGELRQADEKAMNIDANFWKGMDNHGQRTMVKVHFGLPKVGARIRRLTPRECERLMTIRDDYTTGISDTGRYRALGNGWCVDVVAHILGYL